VAVTLPRFGGDDAVQVLVDVLPALSGNDLEEVRQLVRQLGAGMARGLLVALGEEEDRSRRRLLFDLLSSMPDEVAGEARRLLADGRWFVVRNMIALLRAAGDREAVTDLRACLRHADARVRLEALRALTELDRELPRDLLDALLDDPDPKVAALAVQASGRLGGAAAVERLLEVVTPLDPLGRHRELRVRSLLALGAIGDPAVLPRIKRFFSAFSVDALEERRAAFKSLEGYPAAARAPWVAKGVKSRDAEIRQVCRRLARREDADG
jgi:HEAT repeat protein